MKKLTFAILGLVVLLIPLLAIGCETTGTGTAAPVFITKETYDAGINALQALINAKANQTDITALGTRLDTHITQTTTANTYSKGELYTRAEVDAAIAAAVAALKANQTWITGSTGGTSGGTGGGTIVTQNCGDGCLYRVYQKPNSPVYIGGQTYAWALEITNTSNKWKKIQLSATLNPDSTISNTGVVVAWGTGPLIAGPPIACTNSAGSYTNPCGTYFYCPNYALAGTNPNGVLPTYVTPGTPTSSIMFGPPGSNGAILTIGSGVKILIWVNLNLVYTTGVTQWLDPIWNVTLVD